ncbi:hypothetical protein EUTSA_v10009529mg [Eutrema salsugineum]|uniref:Uncharacterized protein n=1 Tax=Eutrema salsugineum TaxID=72664 RepID=V4L2W7_EUTSA|nr:uncharacterized protein LOC18992288 [Eutrema salsugineum]ESQ34083.1 hypothetical protein EUTSA_v10009529mg [Eutrema salsugineum]
MERKLMASSRKVQREDEKKEKSVDTEDYYASNQVSDESEELEKSCLTEEEEDDYLSDQNSHKRRREEAATTCESKKRKKHDCKPRNEFRYDTLDFDDDWLFGTVNKKQKKTTNDKAAASTMNDVEDMNKIKLQLSSSSSGVVVSFPRAQFLSKVGIFALPYTVPF